MCLLGTGQDYNATTARKLACSFGTRNALVLGVREMKVPYAGHLSLATNLAALEHLAPDWRELQSASPHPHGIFQSLDWCLTWARLYAKPGHGIEPCVVTGYQDGILVFLWPLMKVKQGPLHRIAVAHRSLCSIWRCPGEARHRRQALVPQRNGISAPAQGY